jgi:hypothetical protein
MNARRHRSHERTEERARLVINRVTVLSSESPAQPVVQRSDGRRHA